LSRDKKRSSKKEQSRDLGSGSFSGTSESSRSSRHSKSTSSPKVGSVDTNGSGKSKSKPQN